MELWPAARDGHHLGAAHMKLFDHVIIILAKAFVVRLFTLEDKMKAQGSLGNSLQSLAIRREPLGKDSPICPGNFYPLTEYERRYGAGSGMISDRDEYWMTDSAALLL